MSAKAPSILARQYAEQFLSSGGITQGQYNWVLQNSENDNVAHAFVDAAETAEPARSAKFNRLFHAAASAKPPETTAADTSVLIAKESPGESIASLLNIVGCVFLVVGLVGGFVLLVMSSEAGSDYAATDALSFLITACVAGLLLIGFSSVITLLRRIDQALRSDL